MQGKKLLPNPEHATPEELEIARESSPDKQQYIRLYAIQKLLEGNTYKEVARIFNRNENTLTTWVKKWNEGGVDAMRTIKPQGRPSKLSEDQLLQIKELLLSPSMAQECHWTIVKLHGYLSLFSNVSLSCTQFLSF
jgi:transposase